MSRVIRAAQKAGVIRYDNATQARRSSRLGLSQADEYQYRLRAHVVDNFQHFIELTKRLSRDERSNKIIDKGALLMAMQSTEELIQSRGVFGASTRGYTKRLLRVMRTLYNSIGVQGQSDNPRKARALQKGLIPLAEQAVRMMARDINAHRNRGR